MIPNSNTSKIFGFSDIMSINQILKEKQKKHLEKQRSTCNKISGFNKGEFNYSPAEIQELFRHNIWSTEKENIYNDLKINGDLEEYKISETPFHESNQGLKKRNLIWNYTAQEIEEIKKCHDDVIYFAENYCHVKDENGKYRLIKLRNYQKDILRQYTNNRFNILMASRQIGKSILTGIFINWYNCFNTEKTIVICSDIGPSAVEVLDKIKLVYESLPLFLKPGINVWNVQSVAFDNKNRILAQTTSKRTARGLTVDYLYADEFAHVEPGLQYDFWQSIIPTISSLKNSHITVTSTPNKFDLFYDIWINAISGKNEYNPIRVDWFDVPGRDEEWKKKEIAKLGGDERMFNQEYGLQFISESESLLNSNSQSLLKKIERKFENNKYEILNHIDINEKYIKNFYFDPNYDLEKLKTDKFVVSVDFATGVGRDYSVFNIMKVSHLSYAKIRSNKEMTSHKDAIRLTQIGYFMSNEIDVVTFSKICENVVYNLMNFTDTKIVLETNDNQYNIFVETFKENKNFDSFIFFKSKHSQEGRNKIGIRLNSSNRAINFTKLKMLINGTNIIPLDSYTISQLVSFGIAKNGTYQSSSKNDDVAMCIVNLAHLWMTDTIDSFFYEFIEDECNNTELYNKQFSHMNDLDSYSELINSII